jgi:hypothetical protein
MGEDRRVPALSRRVPGATKWPRPVPQTRPPGLSESFVQRVRAALDAEQEEAPALDSAQEPETNAESPSLETATSSSQGMQVAPKRYKPRARPQTASFLGTLSDPEALTQPLSPMVEPAGSDMPRPRVDELGAPPDSAEQTDSMMRTAPPERTAPPKRTAPAERTAPAVGKKSTRRRRKAAVIFSVIVVISAGSLAFAVSGHAPTSTRQRGDGGSSNVPGGAAATRNTAAAWVAAEVSRAAIVSCDPAMCRMLRADKVPVSNLLELGPGTADPLRSDIVVATTDVRSQFGARLSSVYAPAVIASFGSGDGQIDIRVIAQHGAAAYAAALSADVYARKVSGAQLVRSKRIAISATARSQLTAGQVDSRLLITIASLAALHPVYVVAFSDSGPGVGAGSPLRAAELVGADNPTRTANSASIKSMIAFLRTQHAPYLAARAEVARASGGKTVLRVEFAAPSPLGLLSPGTP